MKKLIPLMLGMALTFGAVSMYAGPQDSKTKSTAKKAKTTKPKKSTEKK